MTFTDRIWSSILKSWSGLITAVGVAASIISFFAIPEKNTVPLNVALVILFIMFVVLGIFIRAAYDANLDSVVRLPKVKTIIPPPTIYRDGSALLLLEPTELLSYDSIVSLYYVEGDIERLSGIGKVVNVQNDKKVQVVLFKDVEFNNRIGKLINDRTVDLTKLIIKPSLPSFYLGAINE